MVIIWKRGIPTVEEVQKHVKEHPVLDEHGFHLGGGLWIAIDDQGSFGPSPSFLRLRVSKPGDWQLVDMIRKEIPANTVLFQNGCTFWQTLSETKWAERSRYLRCTREGIPLEG